MLPWPGRQWEIVPDAEPGTRSIKFPAVWCDTALQCTATASDDQVTLEPLAGLRLEIPLAVWMQIAPHMTALAHSEPPDLPPDLPPAA